ncbi:MAG: type III-A CRISPR-associated RAMP protein Csm3 [Phycisphaerales bacterium]
MSEQRLKGIRSLTGRILVETGLRIGGSAETMEISGLDNPILRNPRTGEPFIPGSSLRGRMRSLAEWYFAELPENGEVTKPRSESRTARVFGIGAANPKGPSDRAHQRGPTRLVVRDALLSDQSREELRKGRPITEVKNENSINRLTSMANPRPLERVLPGVTFNLAIAYRVFDLGDGGAEDERLFNEVVLPALRLVELDALGGGGSRGNGKVRFVDLQLDGQAVALPQVGIAPAAKVG